MAKARKCRHCGEWLEQPVASAASAEAALTDDAVTDRFTPPCPAALTTVLFLLAVVSGCLLLVNEDWMTTIVGETRNLGPGKWRVVDGIFKAMTGVPYELCLLVNMASLLGLLVLFLKGMKSMSRPFTSLIGSFIGLYAFACISVFVLNAVVEDAAASDDAALGFMVLGGFTLFGGFVLLALAVAGVVVQIVLGVNLTHCYKGTDVWPVGLLFIITGCFDIVYYLIMMVSSDNPFGLIPIITSCINTGLYIFLYFKLGGLLGMPSWIKDGLMYVFGLFIAGALVYGINAYQKYGDTDFSNENGTEQVNDSPDSGESMECTPEDIVLAWDAAHNQKDYSAFGELYADKVRYYTATYSNAECVADKRRLLEEKYYEFSQNSVNIQTEDMGEGRVRVLFDKRVLFDGKSRTYRSYLILEDDGSGNWVITAEGDR